MLKNIEIISPMEIENKSFEIITEELGERNFSPLWENIIKRVIHTTADFDYADNLYISKNAVESGIEALKQGCTIVTDTTMAMSGINKRILALLGCNVECFIADEDVKKEAKERGITRSAVAVEKAGRDKNIKIYVVGNAPTALISLYELIESGKVEKPSLVVGVPVGFVNVVESKELFVNSDIPCIIARGRKGGSNVAAAIINAILYTISENRRD